MVSMLYEIPKRLLPTPLALVTLVCSVGENLKI